MLVTHTRGNDQLATVFVGQINHRNFEFAESFQPPLSSKEKWVLIVSCLYGCPVKCLMCDAGRQYMGCMSEKDIFEQIDYLVTRRFPDKIIPVNKFKIQFTRMGEPAFNMAVLDVLEKLPQRYHAPGLIPSISTIGPRNCARFFARLLDIKKRLYSNGAFQLQFSIHTTDTEMRDRLIPTPKLSFQEIAAYGNIFLGQGDRKITLNFIVMNGYPIDPKTVQSFFNPDVFLIKLTPLNPTQNARNNHLETKLNPHDAGSVSDLAQEFKSLGFEVIVSIGELEENRIGSNCGQYVS
ncbi:MAG TPA: radical SAM protein [Candidatus Nanoarchaeia archaeon]|nr:radical SAM protein [Candidatus Nanoarchaeia archaeon]